MLYVCILYTLRWRFTHRQSSFCYNGLVELVCIFTYLVQISFYSKYIAAFAVILDFGGSSPVTVLATSKTVVSTVKFPKPSKPLSMTEYLAMLPELQTFRCSVLSGYLVFLRKDVSWRILQNLYSRFFVGDLRTDSLRSVTTDSLNLFASLHILSRSLFMANKLRHLP